MPAWFIGIISFICLPLNCKIISTIWDQIFFFSRNNNETNTHIVLRWNCRALSNLFPIEIDCWVVVGTSEFIISHSRNTATQLWCNMCHLDGYFHILLIFKKNLLIWLHLFRFEWEWKGMKTKHLCSNGQMTNQLEKMKFMKTVLDFHLVFHSIRPNVSFILFYQLCESKHVWLQCMVSVRAWRLLLSMAGSLSVSLLSFLILYHFLQLFVLTEVNIAIYATTAGRKK